MPSSGCQTCARSEEHTSELQSHSHLVCRLLLENRRRSEEHTSELQSHSHLVCRLLLEKKKSAPRSKPTATARNSRSSTDLRRSTSAATALPSLAPPASLRSTFFTSPTSFFFFNDRATTEIYTLSLPDALPI